MKAGDLGGRSTTRVRVNEITMGVFPTSRRQRFSEPGARDAVPGVEDAIAGRRRPSHPEVREPAVHCFVQGARRARQARFAARERRDGAGVIAASAGNHAQGVAHHAQRLGLRAVIVMPRQRGRPHLLGGFRSPGVLSVTCRFEPSIRAAEWAAWAAARGRPWPRTASVTITLSYCLRQIDVASHVVS